MKKVNTARVSTLVLAALMAAFEGIEAVAAPAVPPAEPTTVTDQARDRVWVLTREGVRFHSRKSASDVVDIPLPGWQWAGPPYGCMPALALGPKGEAVVTSDVLPTLWVVDPQARAVSVHPLQLDTDTEKDIGFSRLTYSSRQGAWFAVNPALGSYWKIDRNFRTARKTAQQAFVPCSSDCPVAGCR